MLPRHLSTSLPVQREHLQILLGPVPQQRPPFPCVLEVSTPAFLRAQWRADFPQPRSWWHVSAVPLLAYDGSARTDYLYLHNLNFK